MGHTKGQRRADIRALADTYKIPIKLSEGQIDQCAEIGAEDTFLLIFARCKHLFLASAVFTSGDAWPANFFGLAGRYYKSGSPNKPGRLVHPAMLAQIDPTVLTATGQPRNPRVAASTNYPVATVYDNKFFIYGQASMTLEHYLFPVPLSDPAIDDAQTDTMPEWSEPIVARAGMESMLKMLLDEKTAFELNQQEIEHMEQQILKVYKDKFELINATPQLREAA